MFKRKEIENKNQEVMSENRKLSFRIYHLEAIIMQLLGIEPVEKGSHLAGGVYYQKWHEYPEFNIKVNVNDQLVMSLDQYNSLKPSVQKRLRELEMVTVPINENTDYLKLKEDLDND